MQYHKYANLFPLMEGIQWKEFIEDIKKNGVNEPVWIFNEEILDGRNRYRATISLGIECEFKVFNGTDLEALNFVISRNLHRRHLSESQRAMVGAKLKPLFEVEAHKNQVATLRQNRIVTNESKQYPNNLTVQENSPKRVESIDSNRKAAESVNVSDFSIKQADIVLKQGTPELVKAVESGQVAVSSAALVAKEYSKEDQSLLIARGESEILKKAAEIRAKRAEGKRAERVLQIVNKYSSPELDLSAGKFQVIYADPPWKYDFTKDNSDAIEEHYPTMELSDICNLQVGNIASEDSVLFLWATSPKLEQAFQVINAWGFTYKTSAIWNKEWIGPGYYFRQQHEFLLVATKGNLPTPGPSNRVSSVVSEKRTEHSRKPIKFYEIIESMYPEFRKIELFSRSRREGWYCWGNELNEKDSQI